jgi:hypothetical protein
LQWQGSRFKRVPKKLAYKPRVESFTGAARRWSKPARGKNSAFEDEYEDEYEDDYEDDDEDEDDYESYALSYLRPFHIDRWPLQ